MPQQHSKFSRSNPNLGELCICGHTRLDHELDEGLEPCVLSSCQCSDFTSTSSVPSPRNRVTRQMAVDDLCICGRTWLQHWLGKGCRAFSLAEPEPGTTQMCRCGHPRSRHTFGTFNQCQVGECRCREFFAFDLEPPAQPDICQMCHGEHGKARFVIRVELFHLEDLPMGHCHWLLCEHCLATPIAIRFTSLVKDPIKCDA